MALAQADGFDTLREHLRELSDEELHQRFWSLVDQVVAPLIDEARTHTTPAIERSVLLRMGLTSREAATLVNGIHQRGWLGHGAGKLLLQRAQATNRTIRVTAEALLAGREWEELAP